MNRDDDVLVIEGVENIDKGELSQVPISPEEAINASREKVITNLEIAQKVLSSAVESGIIDQNQAENFFLPNRTLSISKMKTEIDLLNNQINAHEISESVDDVNSLLSQRAELVTEMIYSVTALISKNLTSFTSKVRETIAAAKADGNTITLENQITRIQKFVPIFESFYLNSVDVMKYIRDEYADRVSTRFLGELNSSLYIAINLNADNLSIEEKVGGGGTVCDQLYKIKNKLQPLFAFSINDLNVSSFSLEEESEDEQEEKPEDEPQDGNEKIKDENTKNGDTQKDVLEDESDDQ